MFKPNRLMPLLVAIAWLSTGCLPGGSSSKKLISDDTATDTATDTFLQTGTDSGSAAADSATATDSVLTQDSDTGTDTVGIGDTDTTATDSDTADAPDSNTGALDSETADTGTGTDATAGTDDTETVDTDTVPECYGKKMCDGTTLMLCGETDWVAYRDCAADGTVCEQFMDDRALCVAGGTVATGLVLTEVSQLQIAPAGVRVVFSVERDNGMPASGLTDENFTIINDETGQMFDEGGGAPAIGESEGIDFYTILTLDMSDSMFTPDDNNAAAEAVAAAKLFVQNHVAGIRGTGSHYVAIYAFGSTVQSELVQNFTNDVALLNATLDALLADGSRGGTNLYGAYMASLDTIRAIDTSSGPIRTNMILLSDGLHESGSKDEMRAQALESLALGGVDVFALAMPGEYDESEIRELASMDFYFYTKDDGATVAQKFDLIGDTMAYMTGGNYVVGVCSPLESASSFTVKATRGELTGSMVVSYTADVEGWTGDVSQCDEMEIANPCLNQECGTSTLLPDFQCGDCPGNTEYCDAGLCIDDCQNLFCGDSPFLSLSCGTCGADQLCRQGVCEENNELKIEAECAIDMAVSTCNAKYPGTNSNLVGDGHWDDQPYPALTPDGDLGYTAAGSWIAFENIDLTRFNKVTIRYASNEDINGEIATGFNVRADAPDGPLLGQLVTDNTGGWTQYLEASDNLIASTRGIHTVYLVAASSENINNGNIDWVMFHKAQ